MNTDWRRIQSEKTMRSKKDLSLIINHTIIRATKNS